MGNTSTILIAEDNEDDIALFRYACEQAKLPYTVRCVHDGQQALDYLQGNPPYDNRHHFPLPDLFVVDLRLPRVDGFGLLKWLKASPTLRNLPVIVLSCSYIEKDKDAATQLGAREFHVKAVRPSHLTDFVRGIHSRWLDNRSAARL